MDERESKLTSKELLAFNKCFEKVIMRLGVSRDKLPKQGMLQEENGSFVLTVNRKTFILKDFTEKSKNSALSYQYSRFDPLDMQGFVVELAPSIRGDVGVTEKELKEMGILIYKLVKSLERLPYSLNSVTFNLVIPFKEGYIRRSLFNKSEQEVRLG